MRRALLASAATHFAAHGFAGANINQISVDAGFAKGTVYNYFSSKSALFEAVLLLGSARTVEDYRARAVRGDIRAHLLALAEADVALVQAHPAVMQTFVRQLVAPDERTRDVLLAGLAPLVTETTAILRRGQGLGEVRRDRSPGRLATAFLGHLTMAYVQQWLRPDPDWDGLAAEVVAQFLDGARVTRAPR
ncbi:MAG: TetR/AcrR family transcriptional regulator [Myxococcota bacterium]